MRWTFQNQFSDKYILIRNIDIRSSRYVDFSTIFKDFFPEFAENA